MGNCVSGTPLTAQMLPHLHLGGNSTPQWCTDASKVASEKVAMERVAHCETDLANSRVNGFGDAVRHSMALQSAKVALESIQKGMGKTPCGYFSNSSVPGGNPIAACEIQSPNGGALDTMTHCRATREFHKSQKESATTALSGIRNEALVHEDMARKAAGRFRNSSFGTSKSNCAAGKAAEMSMKKELSQHSHAEAELKKRGEFLSKKTEAHGKKEWEARRACNGLKKDEHNKKTWAAEKKRKEEN